MSVCDTSKARPCASPTEPAGPAFLRVLHVINMGTTCGGAERLLADVVREQRAAGHVVQVLSSDLTGSGTRFNDVAWPQADRSGNWLARLRGQLRNPAAGEALADALRLFRPDVVHLHTVGLLAPASLAVLVTVPTVLTVHGPELYIRGTERCCLPAGYYRHGGAGPALTLRGRLVVLATAMLVGRRWRRELRVVDVTVAPSRYLADLVSRDLGRTRVVANGVDCARPAPVPPAPVGDPPVEERRPSVLFAGRLEHFKGPQVAVEAMPRVLAEHPGARLSICGAGPLEPALRALVERHGLAGSVELTGWLDAAELQRRLAAADLAVVPSVWPESFGLSCLEAFAAGVPVVATDLGGLPDLVRPGVTGTLVPPGDAGALARGVSDLLADDERRDAMGRTAREVHGRYTLAAHVAGVQDAYREAIGGHPAGRGSGRSDPRPFARLAERVRATLADSLLRNSALLLLSTVLLAGGGFLFWQVVTHLLTPAEVGQAGALVSVSTLLVNLALLGLNNSLIRYLGEWPDRTRTVNTAMTVVAGAALLGTAIFLVALPQVAPALVGMRHPADIAVFAALSVAGAVSLYYDNVFVALRRSGFVLWRNILVVVLRLALPLLVLRTTAFDIFTAYWLALALALPLYIVAARRFGLHARLAVDVRRVRTMWRYSAANYLATAILMTPSLLMPVLVAQRVGTQQAAYYYIASLVASVLVFVPQATARSFFAEVSHDPHRLREQLSRVVVVTAVPQALVLAALLAAGPLVLGLFGTGYVHAYPLLVLLALTNALSAVGFIGSTVLLVHGRTRLLCQLSAGAYTVGLLGAYALTDYGLVGIGAALLGGELLLAAGYLRVIRAALRSDASASSAGSRPEHRKLVS